MYNGKQMDDGNHVLFFLCPIAFFVREDMNFIQYVSEGRFQVVCCACCKWGYMRHATPFPINLFYNGVELLSNVYF